MATYSDFVNQYEPIRRQAFDIANQITFLADEVRRGAGYNDIVSRATALNNQIDSNIDRLNNLADSVESSDLTASQKDSLIRVITQTGEGYLDSQTRLNSIIRQAQNNDYQRTLQQQAPEPTAIASEEVDEEAQAREPDAVTQTPPAEQTVFDDADDETPVLDSANRNTNARTAPTRSQEESELQNSGGTSTVVAPEGRVTASLAQGGGATSNTDDAFFEQQTGQGVSTTVEDRPVIASEFLQRIVPEPNRLTGLASQTYTISIYLMDIDEYTKLLTSQRKVLPTRQLIVQSGGIPFGDRNPWFLEDFYIEDLEIETQFGSQSTGAAHNVATMTFTILEPQGITFLNRLNNAIKQHNRNAEASETNQNYLMVIRFYGYDDAGNIVSGKDLGLSTEPGSDPRSIVEKFIPFQIGYMNYKINSRSGTEYRIQAVVPQTNIGFSTSRATIPFNTALVAPDVQTLLNGNFLLAEGSTTTNGGVGLQGATVTQGLAEALNRHEREFAAKKSFDYPDIFEIELANVKGLVDAKMAKPGRPSKKNAPMNTNSAVADRLLTSKSSFDKNTKTYNIVAGTQIVQLIDLVIRNSTYITSQQNIIFDPKTGQIQNQDPVQTVQWFRIRCQVTPYAYDTKRKDYAYRIKYTVSPYQINTPRSAYFPPAAYRGTHKLYNYWFTGENTEVLDFEIEVNANYHMTVGNDGLTDENPGSGRWAEKRSFQARPNESSQGGEQETTMPAANLAERLYNYADVSTSSVSILGDPDWLQQAEIFYTDTTYTPFLNDGSVNTAASEILYEMRFNPVNDYDLATGLTPVYQNNTTYSEITGEFNLPQESLVYAATTCTNYFRDGVFTQKLNGVIRNFLAAEVDTTIPEIKAPIDPGANTTVPERTPPRAVAEANNRDLSTQNVDINSINDDQGTDDLFISP